MVRVVDQPPNSDTGNMGVGDGHVVGYCQLDLMKYSVVPQGRCICCFYSVIPQYVLKRDAIRTL